MDVNKAKTAMPPKASTKLWSERILWCLAFIGAMAVIYLYSTMYSQILRHEITNDLVYGRWVEQNVALYNQDELRFSEQGVHRNGMLIATNFEFDGNSINISIANRKLHYRMVEKSGNKIQQQGTPFYQPTFMRITP